VHAALGALIIAGGRACSTSTWLTHPVITNETSPHPAETLEVLTWENHTDVILWVEGGR
jgi:hypothetical protein